MRVHMVLGFEDVIINLCFYYIDKKKVFLDVFVSIYIPEVWKIQNILPRRYQMYSELRKYSSQKQALCIEFLPSHYLTSFF
jgi:hypothetical protein